MPSEPIDVEISLVNTNNRELVLRCLRSIPVACQSLSWRTTVIDNASSDGSVGAIEREFDWVRVERNACRLGFSANHNQVIVPVIENGSARYVLILNEDTELAPGSIAELVGFADGHEELGAVGPELRGIDGRPQLSYLPLPSVLEQISQSVRPSSDRRVRWGRAWLNASCVLVRVEALRDIGPLDERFYIFFEDTDLGRRLHDAGWRSAICASASVVHLGHQTVSQLGSPMARQFERSRFLYFRKHHGRTSAALVIAGIRLVFAARGIKAVLEALLRRESDPGHARALFELARYDPRPPLPHER